MEEAQPQQEKGPLPRNREAVDWWLKKWGRQVVLEGREPLTREDVERLIEVNGGTAGELFLPGRNLLDADLEGLNISGANFQEATLSVANLKEARLLGVNLKGADLHMANLQAASLSGANLYGTNLELALLQMSYLMNTNLQNAAIWTANLQGAFLWEADLTGADLRGSNLQGADLRRANLQGAYMPAVRISPDTNLEGVRWDRNYVNVLERKGDYEAAIALYRRLKEWYRGAGMLKIAGEFHYREMEAQRKAGRRKFWEDIKQLGGEFKEFKQQAALEWKRLTRKEG